MAWGFGKKDAPPPAAAPATLKDSDARALKEQQLKNVTERIRSSENLTDLLIGTAAEAKETIHADRITIYAADWNRNTLVSRVMDGKEVLKIEVEVKNSSLAGYVARNCKPLNIGDAYDATELGKNHFELSFDRTWDEKTGYRTRQVLCVPVAHKGKVQGVIQAINKKSPDGSNGAFSPEEQKWLTEVADKLAPDLAKLKSAEDTTRELELQKRLRTITEKIHNAANIDEILLNITDDIMELLDVQGVTIYAMDKQTNELFSKVLRGDDVDEIRVALENSSVTGFCAKNNKTVIINDAYNDDELHKIHPDLNLDKKWDQQSGKHTKTILAFPLISGGVVNGVIQLINKIGTGTFNDFDLDCVRQVATTLSVALGRQKKGGARKTKFDALISAALITPEKLEAAQRKAQSENESVERILMSDEFKIPIDEIGKCYSAFFRTDFIRFDKEMQIPIELISDITPELLKNAPMGPWVPVDKEANGAIRIAMENPKDLQGQDEIKLRMKKENVKFCCSTKSDIIDIVNHYYGITKAPVEGQASSEVDSALIEELKAGMEEEVRKEEEQGEKKEDDSAVVKLVNQIIEAAYARRASDIHIEPYTETDTIVRYRVDGTCFEFMKVPKHWKNALASRIKIMCGLDIAERRLPQDGKIKFKNFGKIDIELRVATIPTVGGNEDIVMRILAASKPAPIDKMGFSLWNLERWKVLLEKPYGIALVVGPTGSGKTTTLHSSLGYLNRPEYKIWTAEDPVEITQYQLRQVQVLPKIGFTFERAMRAFLRGDPDIIMVGEMRDLETTSTGVEASLTGHQVFSTLHTNNAPETVTRLLDMGIDPFSFADALLGVLAQRLVRTVCGSCAEAYHPAPEEYALLKKEFGNDDFWEKYAQKYTDELMMKRPKEGGCNKCGASGMKGRMGIHELLVATDEVKAMIHHKPTATEMMDACVKDGMVTMKQDGIIKCMQGKSTLAEILASCMK